MVMNSNDLFKLGLISVTNVYFGYGHIPKLILSVLVLNNHIIDMS